jgi:hypothetical protein
VVQSTNPCPIDAAETAEGYIQQKFSPAGTEAFEDYYIRCPACVAVLQQAALFVEAMTAALRRSSELAHLCSRNGPSYSHFRDLPPVCPDT